MGGFRLTLPFFFTRVGGLTILNGPCMASPSRQMNFFFKSFQLQFIFLESSPFGIRSHSSLLRLASALETHDQQSYIFLFTKSIDEHNNNTHNQGIFETKTTNAGQLQASRWVINFKLLNFKLLCPHWRSHAVYFAYLFPFASPFVGPLVFPFSSATAKA